MNMLVFFLAKCVRNAVKTVVVDRKKQKALSSSVIFGVETLQKAANSSGVPTEFELTRQIWNFSAELYRLIFFA